MQEAGKTLCPADIEHEAHACISSESHQTREVSVWIPKRRAQKAHVSEVSPPRRNVQQHEVCAFSQRHKFRISMTKRGTHKVRVSQVLLDKCDIQQRKVHVSSQQRHKTHISKSKRESYVYSIEHELRVSEACVSELRRKVNIRSPTTTVIREPKSPRP